MPGRPSGRRLRAALERAGLRVASSDRRRFRFPLRAPLDAALARRSLYALGGDPSRLASAERVIARRSSPRSELPLLTIVAVRR